MGGGGIGGGGVGSVLRGVCVDDNTFLNSKLLFFLSDPVSCAWLEENILQ